MDHIRNFSIIAHIDHGKSTLADRMLEITGTIEEREMRDQVLDSMDLERERGITIKMQPVRMNYTSSGTDYVLNLIDTPGHIDFSYEVSRALKAVEGSILLVDSTQGVQAQTFSTLSMAEELGLTIIPVLSKIDSPLSRVNEVKKEVANLLSISEDSILTCSGKTGDGVEELLKEVIKRVPAPKVELSGGDLRALVFDFDYSNHRGITVYVRIIEGSVSKNNTLSFAISGEKFTALEVGTFTPTETPRETLGAGEIGYIVTGIKKPGIASVGDTVRLQKSNVQALPGYMTPKPVIWASLYTESQDDFTALKQSLDKLSLSDSSLSYEEESSGTLGRGFRCGFLGMLHLEIVTERLHREFNLELIVTSPSITYQVEDKSGKKEIVYSPIKFPAYGDIARIWEPWVTLNIIVPAEYHSVLMPLLYDYEATVTSTDSFGDLPAGKAGGRMTLIIDMPLRELMRHFFDRLKQITAGYASFSYEIGEMREADVVRLDMLVAEEVIPAFSKVISRRKVQEEAEQAVEKLSKILPRQQFVTKIQALALGRILSATKLSALKKDVTANLYGGDITRKMKLREKQKKGKKKMLSRGKVNIPQDVFMKMMRGES